MGGGWAAGVRSSASTKPRACPLAGEVQARAPAWQACHAAAAARLAQHSPTAAPLASPLAAAPQEEAFLKRYIEYCRQSCSPRIADSAARLLASEYVELRAESKRAASADGSDIPAIPVTVRARVRAATAVMPASVMRGGVGARTAATSPPSPSRCALGDARAARAGGVVPAGVKRGAVGATPRSQLPRRACCRAVGSAGAAAGGGRPLSLPAR